MQIFVDHSYQEMKLVDLDPFDILRKLWKQYDGLVLNLRGYFEDVCILKDPSKVVFFLFFLIIEF